MTTTPAKKPSLRSRAAKMKWFHALDLGHFQTSGRFPPGQPQNITLFPVMDLAQHINFGGLDCLDIGTAHGLSAFGMKIKGANRVVATDIVEERSPPWELARQALRLDVEYVTGVTIANILDKLPGQKFDVVIIAGVIYHMLNPFDALLKARKLLKRNGLLILESAYLSKEERPILDFNAESVALKEIYTYWMPSRKAMTGMLRLAGFDPLAERSIAGPDRLAIIARNVAYNEVRDRTDICQRMHETGIWDPDVIDVPPGPLSSATYSGPTGARVIDWNTYVPNWAPHPIEQKDVVGSTVWMSSQRNY